MYEILDKAEVANVYRFVVSAPEIARAIRPGQFVMVMASACGERIPLTVAAWNAAEGTITLYVLETGISTLEMARMHTGDSFHAVTGPLGTPSDIRRFGRVLLGGGCYGIGAIYPLAKACREAGNRVICIIEARYGFMFYHEQELQAVSDQVLYATSDGSKGIKGKVEDVVKDALARGVRIDRAFFIGCPQMMERCSEATRPSGVPTRVALNSIMLDGTGMCGACRVAVGGALKFACVDGPEFDGHQVDWKELHQRRLAYEQHEVTAYHYYAQACAKS